MQAGVAMELDPVLLSRSSFAYIVNVAVQETQNAKDLCGSAGVAVSPITTAFAESLGMAEPYGAIFEQPETVGPPPPPAPNRATCSLQSTAHP
jgi:hypothetical protein